MERKSDPEVSEGDPLSELFSELEKGSDEKTVRDLFNLSGGVMRASARTSNRIDGLLTRMMDGPSAGIYHPDADRNLDFLYTYLKLDMIDMVASDVSSARAKAETKSPLRDVPESPAAQE